MSFQIITWPVIEIVIILILIIIQVIFWKKINKSLFSYEGILKYILLFLVNPAASFILSIFTMLFLFGPGDSPSPLFAPVWNSSLLQTLGFLLFFFTYFTISLPLTLLFKAAPKLKIVSALIGPVIAILWLLITMVIKPLFK